MEMASWTAATKEPTSKPETAVTPKRMPVRSEVKITMAAGGTISLNEASVLIIMQAS
jgi:hypothetical protein